MFTDSTAGILKAMSERDLRVMAFPGARIPPCTSLPGDKDVCILARGGPSYASRAIVWRRSQLLNVVAAVEDVGSDRRLAVCIARSSGSAP